MADRPTIERIAKILARANSDNEAEAEAALRGAFARMNRDGVSFSDLLSLPERDLYQDALVRLAEYIVKNQSDLSPSQRRDLYAAYLARIVAKFSGSGQGREGESSQDQAQREREEQARAYEGRRRQEEARRGRSEVPPRQEQPSGSGTRSREPFKRQNGSTTKFSLQLPLAFDAMRFPISFSPSQFFFFFFGASSYIGSIYSYPKLAVKLLFTSIFVGFLTAGALALGGAYILKIWPFEPLRWLYRFLFFTPEFGFSVIIFITSYVFYERGWYPRGPRQGSRRG